MTEGEDELVWRERVVDEKEQELNKMGDPERPPILANLGQMQMSENMENERKLQWTKITLAF